MKICVIIISILFLTSCSNFRVFQNKVPEPVKKNQNHLQSEKKGAFYLAKNTQDNNKNVADALSRSLGLPEIIEEDSGKITKDLITSSSNYENRIYGLNTKLENLKGKEVEGTGFNVFPITSILGIILLVVVCILFPSAVTILFFILKRTRLALANVVSGVKEFTQNNPEESKGLDEILEKKLDRAEKKLKWKYENG